MISLRAKTLIFILNKYQSKLESMSISDARVYFNKFSPSGYRPAVSLVENKVITKNGVKTKVRLYKNKGRELSQIIYFHGGGFALGSLDSHDNVARLLCKSTGSSVVSVETSLSPESVYPEQINQGLDVLSWLIDTNKPGAKKIFLAGDSTGAHIAVGMVQKLDVGERKNISGLILMYPVLDPSLSSESVEKFSKDYFVSEKSMRHLWGLYLNNQTLNWPPDNKQLKGFPAVFIRTAEFDMFRDEGRIFSEQLKSNGMDCDYQCYKSTVHGFMNVPSLFSRRNKMLSDISSFTKKIVLK